MPVVNSSSTSYEELKGITYIRHPLYSDYGVINDENKDNKIINISKNKFINDYVYSNGTVRINIKILDKFKFVNKDKFVYECFTGEILTNHKELIHIDNDKGNNKFSNLKRIEKTNKTEEEEYNEMLKFVNERRIKAKQIKDIVNQMYKNYNEEIYSLVKTMITE